MSVAVKADKEAGAGKSGKGGGHTGVMGGAMVGTAIVVWPLAPVWLLMHGKEAKIPEGTEITAYVDGDRVYPVAGTPAPAMAPASRGGPSAAGNVCRPAPRCRCALDRVRRRR